MTARGDIMLQSDLSSTTRSTQAAVGRTAAVLPAFLAAFLGVMLIWGVGFAGPQVIHNAAHDGRHAHAFPCH
ncbi:CbtB domain-containing protein [Virgifigura deserti]|uniref:CbtB domain-containing protein n=1 Tax=Virgifigura deserti TaxID=2268457 RepID=UPI003CCB7FF2